MISSSNIFTSVKSLFQQTCEKIESDKNYRNEIVNMTNNFVLYNLLKEYRHSKDEILVIRPESETDSEKIYCITKTAFHIDIDDIRHKFTLDAALTPERKIAVSKKDGTIKILSGLHGLPGCGHILPFTKEKLEDFLNQPCVLSSENQNKCLP